MHTLDYSYVSLVEIAGKLRSREISPVELTELMLGRIDQFNPRLNCFLHVTRELALKQAAQAQREIGEGRLRGPLHGVPVAVKDLCFTRGIPTTGGMSFRKDFRPARDATVVQRLRDAGAVLLGKLHLTEGACIEHHRAFGNPVNPWRADLWTGASSSGSGVAVAAGLCFAAIGSDTGGSIRFPSSQQGLTGLKPTWGRVSRHGIFDLAPSYDTLGPMARSAADVAATMGVIAGSDPLDPTALPDSVPDYLANLGTIASARGVRIGIDRSYNNEGADERIISLLEDAVRIFASLGARIEPVIFPDPKPMMEHMSDVHMAELAAVHAETYPAMADDYGRWITKGLESGRRMSPQKYASTSIEKDRFAGRLRQIFNDIDVLIMPVFSFASPTWVEFEHMVETDISRLFRFTIPFNASGSPTITFPAGFTEEKRPAGIQLVGPHLSEPRLLNLVHVFQTATDWHLATKSLT
ncbi:amidase [Mesorhizobium sp.]|uniref:amidase n=1 Tax=Mesorhizobium sp. TaxID=1871066 RepID=UPI000FE4289A|nr:amidase [Mesorhizobium sp.]RWH72464.1 MAG: amidase [Mesorhizobium sp.]RWL34652.1 MAG: amidase [Mesorhizobium sp.]RWL36065.1 MAG: amidase [Mesorhizobium sp.]RWL41476.1 MAG: amidase [Mesorhizobium sp.]RWL50634.1 MAG: amidase [Mesorhizobium sp.]